MLTIAYCPGPGPSTPSSASTSAAARPSPLRRTDSNSLRSQSRPGRASNPYSQSSWASQESNSSIIIVSDGEDEYDDDYDDYDDDDDDEDSENLSGLEPEPAKRPRLDTDSQGNPLMPNLLAGVAIPDGPARFRICESTVANSLIKKSVFRNFCLLLLQWVLA